MKKKFALSICTLLMLSGCGAVELTNGKNALVTFSQGDGISTDDLYQELKSKYGADAIEDLIDKYLLDIKYKSSAEENNYVNQQVKTLKQAAESMGADVNLYLTYYYGYSSLDEFKDHARLEYRRGLYATDYAKAQVTEKEINDYYETQVIGDIEASQILISIDVKDGATDEEKEDAKDKALKEAEEIIQKLKDGEDFAGLAKKYSDDTLTSKNGGVLGKVNKDDVSEEIINALISLEDGAYTTSPVESTTGYYILYRTSQDEKSSLTDELTDEIRTTIAKETAENDPDFENKALDALRKEFKMDIKDKELENAIGSN